MGFPSVNAHEAMRSIGMGHGSLPDNFTSGYIPTGLYNMFSTPAVVDVSGMEFSVVIDNDGGITGRVASLQVAASSPTAFMLGDGGPSGDVAGTAGPLMAAATNSAVAWAAHVPKDVAGSSTTDLDADDWVNAVCEVAAATAGLDNDVAAAAHINVAYVYGKPGSIA